MHCMHFSAQKFKGWCSEWVKNYPLKRGETVSHSKQVFQHLGIKPTEGVNLIKPKCIIYTHYINCIYIYKNPNIYLLILIPQYQRMATDTWMVTLPAGPGCQDRGGPGWPLCPTLFPSPAHTSIHNFSATRSRGEHLLSPSPPGRVAG